jgi:hypothetical protein
MADTTVVSPYPKATNQQADVQAIADNNIKNLGAKSSVVTEDTNNWILTTVWPGGNGATSSGST